MDRVSKSPSRVSIIGGASELLGSQSSYSAHEENHSHSQTRFTRSSIRSSSAVRMSSSMNTSAGNNSIVSNNYDCLASTSSVFESSDDSVDFHDYNKALRILDDEFEFVKRNQNYWVHKANIVLSYTARSLINVVCIPIYWILVQNFVFEKWILNRRKAIAHPPKVVLSPLARQDYNAHLQQHASTSGSTANYRGSGAKNWDADSDQSERNNHQSTRSRNTAAADNAFNESIIGKVKAFFTSDLSSNSNTDVNIATSILQGANGNGRLISSASGTQRMKAKETANNENGHHSAFTGNTPVCLNYSRSISDVVNSKVDACRTLFDTCKDSAAKIYSRRSRSSSPNRRRRVAVAEAEFADNGNRRGPSKWWLCLLLFLILGGLCSWLNSDVTAPGSFLLNHILSLRKGQLGDADSEEGAFDIPFPPEPARDLPFPESTFSSHVFVNEPEPVLDTPVMQSELDPKPEPIPTPSVDTDPPAVVPVPIPVPPQVLPPISPEVACVTCPPVNNIDIDALKKELTDHFTTLIEEKCVTKCDCATGQNDGGLHDGGVDIDTKIQQAIKKYDSDKTGLPDLALEPSGGSVVSTRCTKHATHKNSVVTFLGIPIWHPPNNPRTVIQPGLVPGECWSFEGSIGYIVIKLAGPSHIVGFSLEHIPKAISPHGHIESAPKKFQVVGLMDYNDPSTEFLFGNYTYLDNDEPLQYFPVLNKPEVAYPYVELKIMSNHGNIDFTCVYRLRVHGHF